MLAAILTLCGTLSATAQTSYDYFYRSWDADKKEVKTEIRTCTSFTAINGNDTSDSGWVGLYNGWYVVTANSNYKTLNVLGDDVHLIIRDMVTLTLTGGVKLETGKKLTIYSQGGDVGQLTVTNSYDWSAGIGGGENAACGTLVIHGGIVNATGGTHGAGIGGGLNKGLDGDLTIYGGTVNATGGLYGAGIGSGAANVRGNVGPGSITIYDGKVTATAGNFWAAGIGGGSSSDGITTRIYGGTVHATGGQLSAAIGGGKWGSGVATYIYGGTVTADGTIGGGERGHSGNSSDAGGDGGYIEISGGTVNVNYLASYAAAIGCGYKGTSATIKITGGDITANAEAAAGIGGGNENDVNLNLTITGGTIRASGLIGIGTGAVSKLNGTINISGGSIYAKGFFSAFGSRDNTAEAANIITLPATAMVKAGTDASSLEGTFTADQRVPACVYRKYAQIEPCEHSGATYTVSGTTVSDTHLKHCAYCTTAFEAETHTFSNGKCTVCGVEQTTYTVNIYYPASDTDNNYTSLEYQMVPGTKLKLPAPPLMPAKMEFAGWLVDTHSNGSFIADDSETLLEEGAFYTVNNSVTFTARFRYLDITLADAADNGETLVKYHGMTARTVTISGRTLYADGSWNTLCLPFAMTAAQIAASPLADATIKELNSSETALNTETGALTLKFSDVTAIEAGIPYIVKWASTGSNITDPVFSGVTISSTAAREVVSTDQNVKFVGKYSPFSITADNINEILYVATGNKIGYSASARTLRSCRVHFWVKPNGTSAGARRISIDWGDGETTGIRPLSFSPEGESNEASPRGGLVGVTYHSLDGRKLSGVPTQKGVYIVNGKKVVIK